MPLPLMSHSALALFAQRTRIPTSARSIGFCVIWVCISSSSSSKPGLDLLPLLTSFAIFRLPSPMRPGNNHNTKPQNRPLNFLFKIQEEFLAPPHFVTQEFPPPRDSCLDNAHVEGPEASLSGMRDKRKKEAANEEKDEAIDDHEVGEQREGVP